MINTGMSFMYFPVLIFQFKSVAEVHYEVVGILT